MKPAEIQFSLNLEALSSPQCRRIVQALYKESYSQEDLSKICKLSIASVGKHVEILRVAGLVKLRKVDGVIKVSLQVTKLEPTLEWFSQLKN